MRIKKELIEKIVLCVLTFILIMYISLTLVFFSLFHISEKFLNKENLHDIISNINITSILRDELDNELREFSLIKEDLNNIGISTEGINEFINSEDVKEFSLDVITNVFNKVSNKGNVDYKITSNQLNELVKNNIDKLEIDSNIKEEKILSKLEKKIPDLVSNINIILDNFCNKLETSEIFQKYQRYVYDAINILDILYNEFILGIIIFIIISLIALLMFIRKSIYKSLKWISISFVIPTIVLAVISTFILTYIETNNTLINNIIGIVNAELIRYSIIYFIISFVFVIINMVMYIIRKYRRKKKVSYE